MTQQQDNPEFQPQHFPPPLPEQAVIPYATPMPYQQQQLGAWREGPVLVVSKFVSLPPRCVKCNAEVADHRRIRKTLYWHHPALAIMILFPGLLIYAIVALCVRQRADYEASLCPVHRRARNKWIAITWLMSLGALGLLVLGIGSAATSKDPSPGVVCILAAIVMIVPAVIFGGFARVLTPKRITKDFAWLKGAGPDFLSMFPAVTR